MTIFQINLTAISASYHNVVPSVNLINWNKKIKICLPAAMRVPQPDGEAQQTQALSLWNPE